MLAQDTLLLLTSDFGSWSTDANRPDYACPAYVEMAPRWQLCEDLRGGTIPIRQKKQFYLPRFEAETIPDWIARVGMTFVADHYATTLVEHVGLVFSNPPKLGDDVPQEIRDLCEDIDGEGNHLDVFLETAMDNALHLGHAVMYTDYPQTDNIKKVKDEQAAQVRPYVQLYRARDVISWRTVTIGGVKVLSQIVFRETNAEATGEFGVEDVTRFREIKQDVTYDEFTGRAIALGAITWRTWKQDSPDANAAAAVGTQGASLATFTPTGNGTIVGPTRIPARVIYGGQRTGFLQSIPHLMGLAFSNIEETQVASDYAAVMHKCNVPTPIFIGRNTSGNTDGAGQTVQMGQGIDIPTGGDAKMLEPSGGAIAATRQRIEDIRAQMRRQGATTDDATGKVMTAREAMLYAKQRNAKLSRAARSLQDATEGVLEDIAAFLNTRQGAPKIQGGSITVNQDFAGEGIDPAYLTVLVQAYIAGALPLDALLYALEKGRLPEDFSATDSALKLVADEMAKQDAQVEAAKKLAANPAAVAATLPGLPVDQNAPASPAKAAA